MKKILFLLLVATSFSFTAKAQTTYNDVATIFYNRCTSCHHGSGAGFSLLTFLDASAYTSAIQTDLTTNHMPAWPPDTAYTASGHPAQRFLHEHIITSVENAAILQWINDGALEGNPALVPAPPSYDDTKYKLNGTPSLTLKTPKFASNYSVSNTDPHNCFAVPTGLTTNTWLRAFEIVPGNLDAVVHVIVTIDTTGTFQTDTSGHCNNHPGEIYLGSWALGQAPTVYPNQMVLKAGLRIPANSKFIFQIDYGPGTAGMVDSSKIRLFFYPSGETGIRPIHSDYFLQYWGNLGIGGPDIKADSIKMFSATPAIQSHPHPQPPAGNISLLSINPYSHALCKEVHEYALNGTDTIPLLHIEDWTYHHYLGAYYFPKPVKIPTGYTLKTDRLFDNTTGNDNQTHQPPIDINFGANFNDEMIYDSFQWLDYQAGDELLDMNALVANDPLLQVGINEFVETSGMISSVYPNPTTGSVSIWLSKKSEYIAHLFTISGQNILQTGLFNETVSMDMKTIPAGIYIIEITDIKSNDKITKKIVVME